MNYGLNSLKGLYRALYRGLLSGLLGGYSRIDYGSYAKYLPQSSLS